MSNMLLLYSEFGQSTWLDYLDRSLVVDGGLKALVADGLRGVTSNPTIFHKAMADSEAYDDAILDLLQADHAVDGEALYHWLAVQDVQMAADCLAPVYASSRGSDGFVSLEVAPRLAYDADATVESARHLWRAVDRPNLMIKVPGTTAGVLAFERLIAEGINVNVTLLFSLSRYEAVTEAYIRGLALNRHPERVASVASFFVSRVDTKVDAALDAVGTAQARALKGRIAVANARLAYRHFRDSVDSAAFREQRERGARPQRPLWASTSTKNPDYSDLLYVESLIGPETVNTVPPDTLDTFQARGELGATLEHDGEAARRDLEALERVGIDLSALTQSLEREGVQKFAQSHERLVAALETKRDAVARRYAGP